MGLDWLWLHYLPMDEYIELWVKQLKMCSDLEPRPDELDIDIGNMPGVSKVMFLWRTHCFSISIHLDWEVYHRFSPSTPPLDSLLSYLFGFSFCFSCWLRRTHQKQLFDRKPPVCNLFGHCCCHWGFFGSLFLVHLLLSLIHFNWFFFAIYLSFILSFCLSFHLSIFPSIYLSIYLF